MIPQLPLILLIALPVFAQEVDPKVAQQQAEYSESLKKLQNEIEKQKDGEAIRRSVSQLWEESDDVAEALLDDAEAQALKRITQAYPYARLVDAGYHFGVEKVPGYVRLKKNELPEPWQKWFIPNSASKNYPLGKGELIYRKELGFWAAAFEREDHKEIVLVLRGAELRPTVVSDFTKNAKTAAEHYLGELTPHFEAAYALAKALKERYPGRSMVITGSSMGGSASLFAGLAVHARVFAFNSLGLNKKEIQVIEAQNPQAFDHADELVTLVSITGDMVSDSSDLLPKTFTNRYFGTVLKVPFYDDSWSGYLTANHHNSDAIVKSLERYLKGALSAYAKAPVADDRELNTAALLQDLESDEVKIVNRSKSPVTFMAFACTYQSMFGASSTYCDQSMFRYPHRAFSWSEAVSVYPAQSKIPLASVALSSKAVVTRNLGAEKDATAVIRMPVPEGQSWPSNYNTTNEWVYVTAFSKSPNCKVGQVEPFTYLGTPYYSGSWTATLTGGKQLGWLRPSGKNNPRILVISHYGNDPCDFAIEGR